MSQVLIHQDLAELDRLKKVSREARKGIVSEAFKDLLRGWGRQHDLTCVPPHRLDTLERDHRDVDGALLHELRVPFGYGEARDDLDGEIAFKFKRGHPQDNIVFQDSTRGVLIEHGEEVCAAASPTWPRSGSCSSSAGARGARQRRDGGDRRGAEGCTAPTPPADTS